MQGIASEKVMIALFPRDIYIIIEMSWKEKQIK